MEKANGNREISFGLAVVCMLALAAIFIGGFGIFKINTQVVFLLAVVAAAVVGVISGFSLKEIDKFFLDGCKSVIMAAMILMSVGAVIGAWIVSGIVPTIIYYGLSVLTPASFLLTSFFICCILSFFTGSSYSAISTLGVAFMGIGIGLNINPGITAGMIVSGSVFGDKLSPFSDSTNLAAAVSDANVFDHVRSMLYTTIPAMLISAVLYFFISMRYSAADLDLTVIASIKDALTTNFNITPLLLIVPLFTIFLAIKKVPPVIALISSALIGIIAAFIFQGEFYNFKTIMNSMGTGFSINTDIAEINKLLSRGGMLGMMGATALAFLAVGLGEILQRIGVLNVVLSKMNKVVKSRPAVVITTLVVSLIVTVLCASQYIAIILTGQIMKNSFKEFKIGRTVLSRTLEDGGTIFAYLVPWSTTGVFITGVLGIEVFTYAPFAFFCIICPILAAIYALTGFAQFKEDYTEIKEEAVIVS
ncbi:Na+/H+ antiporter NhaC [Gudongella oleilytica]|jgi:NhaC family Na+:H+ antiporter|uniref:Na+/H+ antiporter NhaC n=1 Tax=Gudongella oleilytica TaxID=1582259 RepID=UPI002A370E91|nr:Na+/H+ antiporter NhaC [Gudongella oleilytica]MDY0257627.1 Na+/H+ antiporter NhaC [Gudongella oleilytica]